jgi:hypothetical protein
MTGSSALERFESHVDRTDVHHRWTGSPDPRTGTGQFRLDGKLLSAQRAAWELHVGPLPSGVRVRSCPHDPLCVRVEHLVAEPSRRHIAPTASRTALLPVHMTVSVAFHLYLAHLRREGRSQTTLTVYGSVFRGRINPALGRLPVNELSEETIRGVVDEMSSAAPGAAGVARSILYGLSDWANAEKL